MKTTTIQSKAYDEERALYNLTDAEVRECVFAGQQDGESALKESRDIIVDNCSFSLRYPLWHSQDFILKNSRMDALCRAPIWYAQNGNIDSCNIDGIKCLRECEKINISNSIINSPEFGWKCRGVSVQNSTINSEYLLFESNGIDIKGLKMSGKYSFQYVRDMTIADSKLDTKDAFWHSSNVTVRDSVVGGEYLGWYSDNLTFINCHIRGTQPLCYCTGLTLINCTMQDTDLSFECSDVNADIKGEILSVKNPRSGKITADGIGQVIKDHPVMPIECEIHIR